MGIHKFFRIAHMAQKIRVQGCVRYFDEKLLFDFEIEILLFLLKVSTCIEVLSSAGVILSVELIFIFPVIDFLQPNETIIWSFSISNPLELAPCKIWKNISQFLFHFSFEEVQRKSFWIQGKRCSTRNVCVWPRTCLLFELRVVENYCSWKHCKDNVRCE